MASAAKSLTTSVEDCGSVVTDIISNSRLCRRNGDAMKDLDRKLVNLALLPLKGLIWCILTVGMWLLKDDEERLTTCPHDECRRRDAGKP